MSWTDPVFSGYRQRLATLKTSPNRFAGGIAWVGSDYVPVAEAKIPLLDQGFLAGMGNYLRSEVLFEARIAPTRRPADLSAAERRRLAAALLSVPRASYATRGIEPAEGMRSDYLTDTPTGFRFQVFDREGLPCPACRRRIVRHELGGRRLYWCPRCQQ